jgi:DnaJ-class molecular chaperone
MYDLSQPNEKPGQCVKCRGTGIYRWGNKKEGTCFSCAGTGQQTKSDIGRNHAYNRHKIVQIGR